MVISNEEAAPVSLTLSTSAPTCYGSGDPPFTVTMTHKCTTARPIWALREPHRYNCNGIMIRDPQRTTPSGRYRRIGLEGTYIDNGSESDSDYEHRYVRNNELVHLNPGEVYTTYYTLIVTAKAGGLRRSDVWNLTDGNDYLLTMTEQKWWWMFEDEMPASCSHWKRMEMLNEQPVTQWRPGCSISFHFKS